MRGKKPWAVAAAALLLLGPGALAFKSYREARVYLAPEVTSAITTAKGVTDDVTKKDSEYMAAQKAADEEKKSVYSLVAGQAEFKNWVELTKFVNDCLPRPDGSNLPVSKDPKVDFKKLYWTEVSKAPHSNKDITPMSGEMAFKELNKRLAGKSAAGEGTSKDEFGAGIEDLVQINIQSFDTRFCEDLAGYWSSLDNTMKDEENIRPKEHAKKGPEGKGWIVEIQGYTLHHRKQDFVRDTLLETLAAKGITDPTKATADPAKPASGAKDTATELDIPADGPIVNRISHVLLYQKKQVTVSHKDTPFLIQSNLTELARGMTSDPGGMGGFGGRRGGSGRPNGNANGNADNNRRGRRSRRSRLTRVSATRGRRWDRSLSPAIRVPCPAGARGLDQRCATLRLRRCHRCDRDSRGNRAM